MSRVRFVDQTKFNTYKVNNATTATSASYASFATSASYAVAAGTVAGTVTSASYATTASYAEYAVSASHEIVKEVSSSHANTADTAAGLTGQPSIYVTNITASGDISASGNILLDEDQRIYFEADKQTWIESHASDSFRVVVNGQQMFLLDEDTGNRAVFGNGTKVFIGANNNKLPTSTLHVAGDIWASGSNGNITASGNISASGKYYGDGSELTGISAGFWTGSNGTITRDSDVQITGSLLVSGSSIEFKTSGGTVFSIAETGSFALGEGATNSLDNNVAIGKNAIGAGSHNIAMGNSADSNAGSYNVAIGSGAQTANSFGIAMGGSAYAASSTIAIGHSSIGGTNTISIGYDAGHTSGEDNILIGYKTGNSTSGNKNIIFGSGSLGGAIDNQLRIGNSNHLTTISGSLATGDVHIYNTASAAVFSGSTYYGDGSNLTGISSTPFPFTGDAQITGSLIVSGSVEFRGTEDEVTNVVIGLGSNATGTDQVVIGNGAGISWAGSRNVIIGKDATVANSTNYGTSIGYSAYVTGTGGTAIGHNTETAGYGIALGYNTTAAVYGIAIGKEITANASQLEIGYETPIISASLSTGHIIFSGSTGGLELIGSGSTVFDVIGSEGTLFSVDDDLDGMLFTTNDRTGLPILQASASGELYLGKSPQSLYTTAVISATSASATASIYALSTSSYDGAFFDYTITSASNAQAGTIQSIWNGGSINHTNVKTSAIGSTSGIELEMIISASQAHFVAVTDSTDPNTWKVKTIIRSI